MKTRQATARQLTSTQTADTHHPGSKKPTASHAARPPDILAVRQTIETHFPDLWPAVDLGLSTCATLLLADSANPVAVIYVGAPSSGKTTVASMFEGTLIEVEGKAEQLCYRSDKF